MKFSTIVAAAVSSAIAVSGSPIEKRQVGGVCLSPLLLLSLTLSNLTFIHRSSYAPAPTQPAPAPTTSTNSRPATSCPRHSTITPAPLRRTAKISNASPVSATADPSAPARPDAPLAPSTSATRTSLTWVLSSGIH
jgi:hypothetical protein